MDSLRPTWVGEEAWDDYRDIIEGLYEDNTLDGVRTIMEEVYNFRMTVQQYKNRINVKKNIPKPKMVKMLQRQDKRKAEGKDSIFTFHGRPVASSRLATARARPDVGRALQAAGDLSPQSDIECLTPYIPNSPPEPLQSLDSTSGTASNTQFSAKEAQDVVPLVGVDTARVPMSSGSPGSRDVQDMEMTDMMQWSSLEQILGMGFEMDDICTNICYTDPPQLLQQHNRDELISSDRGTELNEQSPSGEALYSADSTAEDDESTLDSIAIINNLATVLFNQGKFDQALVFFTRALHGYERLGNDRGVATTTNDIGLVYLRQGLPDKAMEYYSQALERYKLAHDYQGAADALFQMGTLFGEQGDYKAAMDYLTQSLAECEAAGDSERAAVVFEKLGELSVKLGEVNKALVFYARVLVVGGDKAGDIGRIAPDMLERLGIALCAAGRYKDALILYSKSLAQFEKVNDDKHSADALIMMGKIHEKEGEYDRAIELSTRALELFEKVRDSQCAAAVASQIGIMYSSQGDHETAVKYCTRAFDLGKIR
ncbi:TPR-like protein [Wilcoxina mikolae CBS 423.85]|nr:TPR-like protein [Wilcoxina mikolae CBS 423.85]